jgi:hypothetical protein
MLLSVETSVSVLQSPLRNYKIPDKPLKLLYNNLNNSPDRLKYTPLFPYSPGYFVPISLPPGLPLPSTINRLTRVFVPNQNSFSASFKNKQYLSNKKVNHFLKPTSIDQCNL